jgi:hypothetical protein
MSRVRVVCRLMMTVAALPALLLPASGGERTNVAGLGMGRTGVAASRGLDAIGINPANLARGDGSFLTVSLLPVGLNMGSDFLTYDLYTEFFTGVSTDSGRFGRYLTAADKQRLLESFPGSTGTGDLDIEARGFGLSMAFEGLGTVAASVTDRIAGRGTLSREYAEFLLFGNPPGSDYDFGQMGGRAAWTREFGLTVAAALPWLPLVPDLSAGVTLKFVQGFSYYAAERFHARLSTSADGLLTGEVDTWTRSAGLDPASSDVSVFPAPAGRGFGFDIGLSGKVNEYAGIGISVTDIGSVNWSENASETIASGIFTLDDPLDPARRDSVERLLKGETREGMPFTVSLPATLRLGAVIELHNIDGLRRFISGELLFAVDYTQGLVDVPGTTRTPRCSFGLEYSPWHFLPLRTGVSLWGAERTGLAFGVGFRSAVVDLDCAVESVGWVVAPATFSRGAFAFGVKFKI